MVLEGPPHCPFDVIEACRTGVRKDSHQPGLNSSRPGVNHGAQRVPKQPVPAEALTAETAETLVRLGKRFSLKLPFKNSKRSLLRHAIVTQVSQLTQWAPQGFPRYRSGRPFPPNAPIGSSHWQWRVWSSELGAMMLPLDFRRFPKRKL